MTSPNPTREEAARARKAHAEERRQDTIDALLHERKGYVQRGLQERVDQVDEQLRRHNVKPPAEKARKVTQPEKQADKPTDKTKA